MIVYQATKSEFTNDILTNDIAGIVLNNLQTIANKSVGKSEFTSWQNSLMYMSLVMQDEVIPKDVLVTIEYHLPQTSKRVDFIISGQDEHKTDHIVLIELKQWSEVELTAKDGVVRTRFRGGIQDTPHPSYQAWSYAALLYGFNQTVEEENIQLKACAYLHNCTDDKTIRDPFYDSYLQKAPVFLKKEATALQSFIKQYIKHGDLTNIMDRIDKGKIRPSKTLADTISSMLKGNDEFVMIDEQKIIYETAVALAKQSSNSQKHVLIIEGGPGTGKSVVAINLLVSLTKLGLIAQYVTKNAAPRAVYESKLTGSFKKSEISNFFSGSGAFINSDKNSFDTLIVDEAHRLNEKSGMFKNLGENQVKEIIEAAKCSIFFIDEDQKVTFSDIGQKDEIEKWAKKSNATVHYMQLTSQFRCNGSDGYLAWLDNALQIRETANNTLEGIDYDFRIVDSASELRDLISEKNKIRNSARLVAGYCWDWVSKKNPHAKDIVIDDFAMKWNLATDGNLWIMSPDSVSEVGCIHTCQGLEIDYVGVIIGPDLIVRNDEVMTDPSARAKTDKSINGYKKLAKINPDHSQRKTDTIIRNTYRTLMTRGSKGCYVYFTDEETKKYFQKVVKSEQNNIDN